MKADFLPPSVVDIQEKEAICATLRERQGRTQQRFAIALLQQLRASGSSGSLQAGHNCVSAAFRRNRNCLRKATLPIAQLPNLTRLRFCCSTDLTVPCWSSAVCSPVSSSPSKYFQSIRERTASAACRSERFSLVCQFV